MSNTKRPTADKREERKSVDDLLQTAKLPERQVDICLRGDLVADVEAHQEQLRIIRRAPKSDQRFGASAGASGLVEQIELLQEQMRESTMTIRVRGLPRGEWLAKVRKHPPRDGVEDDKTFGANAEALFNDVIPLCVVDPELDTEQWNRLNAVLTGGEWDKLITAVWSVNRVGVSVPFLPPDLRSPPNSGSGSRPPEAGG